jgi:tetratricopeptide (TPR) repeat protein
VLDHPSPETLQRLLKGELSHEELSSVVRHLLHGCRLCGKATAPVPEELPEDDEQLWAELFEADGATVSAYDQVIDRGFRVIGGELAEAIDEAQRVGEAYRALVDRGLSGLDAGGRRFQGPVQCLALLRRSQDFVYREPKKVVLLTFLAAYAANNLGPEEWGRERVADLRARAWAEHGNARRVMGGLDMADQAMATAVDQFAEGSQDPPLAARLSSLQASLLGDQRHFPEALALLERAEELYLEVGETGEATRVLVKRGLYAGYEGQTDAAIELLTRGLAQLEADAEADPKTVVSAVHNLAWFLMDAEHWSKAQELLWRSKKLYDEHAEPIVLVKKTWLEARISAGLGHLASAEKALKAAIKELNEAGLGYPAAIASLDLAAVWILRGRGKDAMGLIIQATDTFLALGVNREALGAIHLLQEAAEVQAVTAAILRETTRLLLRLEHQPTARLESD